ncbi:MAG: hypothetical protein QNJ31_03005 [Candidatus Caenarcaniphilales bacterium]|nr:hypothetical protein [Candidatus Caenarcaniphilales bacterium]
MSTKPIQGSTQSNRVQERDTVKPKQKVASQTPTTRQQETTSSPIKQDTFQQSSSQNNATEPKPIVNFQNTINRSSNALQTNQNSSSSNSSQNNIDLSKAAETGERLVKAAAPPAVSFLDALGKGVTGNISGAKDSFNKGVNEVGNNIRQLGQTAGDAINLAASGKLTPQEFLKAGTRRFQENPNNTELIALGNEVFGDQNQIANAPQASPVSNPSTQMPEIVDTNEERRTYLQNKVSDLNNLRDLVTMKDGKTGQIAVGGNSSSELNHVLNEVKAMAADNNGQLLQDVQNKWIEESPPSRLQFFGNNDNRLLVGNKELSELENNYNLTGAIDNRLARFSKELNELNLNSRGEHDIPIDIPSRFTKEV